MLHKYKKNCLIALIILGITGMLSPSVSRATPNEENAEKLQEGNLAYSEKKYAKAIEHYRNILEEQGFSSSLLYNLGNAYHMNGNIGQSILSYERALLLDPGDDQILANLEQVKKDAGLYEEPDIWEDITGRLSFDQWTLLGGTGLILTALIIFTAGVLNYITALRAEDRPSGFPLLKAAAVIFSAVFITGALGAYAVRGEMKKAIVIHDGAKLLISPFDTADAVCTIEPGRAVYPGKRYGEYEYVKSGKAAAGWIRASSIRPVYMTR